MAEKIRVLIVDDSSLVRDLLSKALSAPEHELDVVAAIHGQDALDKLQKLDVDVVVTDMEMPVMNGLDFIRAAMARSPLPIIVLSSWAQNDKNITLQALEAGAADFIPKPSALSPQGFQETLMRLVVKIKAASRIAAPRIKASVPANASSIANVSAPIINIPNTNPVSVRPPTAVLPTLPSGLMQQQTQSFLTPNYEERIPQLILGVGELGAANDYGKIVKTFALGSCVALSLFSPTFDVVGMAHIALATSATSPEKAKVLPGYFADTALPALINEMRAKGYRKPISQLLAKIIGGAQTGADTGNYFKIGEKNVAAITTLLNTLGIALIGEDTGQSFSRTVFIQVGSKAVHVSSPDKKSWVV